MRYRERRPSWLAWLLPLTALSPLLGGCELPSGQMTMQSTADGEDIWAIRCLTARGPRRFQTAQHCAAALKRAPHINPELVQVFHEGDESTVYYGRYRRIWDARTATESFRPDHLRDLDYIRHLSTNIQDPATGPRTVWPFQLATMNTLPVGRGTHPEWLLTHAAGYYSLQVGVFYDTEGMRRRKFAAEEYCRLLREQGEEAYYHHGPVNSSVCIGAFPRDAIQTFQRQDPLTGIIHVTSKIVDERLLALQRRFPHNLHNGSVFYEVTRDPRTGAKRRDPHTSFAVEIPRPGPGADGLAE